MNTSQPYPHPVSHRVSRDRLAGVPMRSAHVQVFTDLTPVTATPGIAIGAAMTAAAVAGSEIGKNAD